MPGTKVAMMRRPFGPSCAAATASAGSTPPITSDDFPLPEAPVTMTRGALRSCAINALMSASRPKKKVGSRNASSPT